MIYTIAHLLYRETSKYQKDLMNEMIAEFGKEEIPINKEPHITLKYDFEIKDSEGEKIKSIRDLLSSLSRTNRVSKYTINGFGNFRDEVLFLEINPTKEIYELTFNLHKRLEKLDGIEFQTYDYEDNIHYHSTLALPKKENYEKMKKWLDKKIDPFFPGNLDNISLISHGENNSEWKIEEIYRIG